MTALTPKLAPDMTMAERLKRLVRAAMEWQTYQTPEGHLRLGYAAAKGELNSAHDAISAALAQRDARIAGLEAGLKGVLETNERWGLTVARKTAYDHARSILANTSAAPEVKS